MKGEMVVEKKTSPKIAENNVRILEGKGLLSNVQTHEKT